MRRILEDVLRFVLSRPIVALAGFAAILCIMTIMLWPEGVEGRDERIASELAKGEIVEIARADDGARLWAVRRSGRTIYFSKGSVAIDGEERLGGS